MKNLTGIKLKSFPFSNCERIGILLYPEYPTTVLYKTEQGTPLVLEWVDCSEHNVDRFLAYECSRYHLLQFFNGNLSHKNLIKSAIKDLIISFEGDIYSPINLRIVPFENLPADYLPHAEVFFNSKEAVEYDKIVRGFNLEIGVKDYKAEYALQALLAEPAPSGLNKKDDPTLP